MPASLAAGWTPKLAARRQAAKQAEQEELLRRSQAASLADQQPVDFGAAARRLARLSMLQVEKALMAELPGAGGHPRPDWEARLHAAEIVLWLVPRAAAT